MSTATHNDGTRRRRKDHANPGAESAGHSHIEHLLTENRVWLEQLYDLLGRLSPGAYTTAEGPFARGGAGKHVRHLLEHYQALLANPSGPVDYDARERTVEIETDPDAARSYIGSLIAGLDELLAGAEGGEDHGGADSDAGRQPGDDYGGADGVADSPAGDESFTVRYNSEAGTHPVESSLARELMFLSSHTVHHLALVRFILEYLGEEVPDELGVALSTLRYERERGGGPAARR